MLNSSTLAARARRSRRSVLKAAAIAAAALVTLSAVPTPADARRRNCFLRGTKIRTSKGYRNIEILAAGDWLPTVFGGLTRIKAIRRHEFRRADLAHGWPLEARPVRIARSALGDNIPRDDLYLTPSHALFIDGVLIPVGNLVNGATITHDDGTAFDRLEYFHVEFESHDVIDAQGAACESLRESNEAGVTAGGGISWQAVPKPACAPVVGFNGGRSEVKSRLRSAISVAVDCREKLDVIRDRLEERSIALSRNAPPVGASPSVPRGNRGGLALPSAPSQNTWSSGS